MKRNANKGWKFGVVLTATWVNLVCTLWPILKISPMVCHLAGLVLTFLGAGLWCIWLDKKDNENNY